MKIIHYDNDSNNNEIIAIGWLSGGVASALACKIAAERYKSLILVRIDAFEGESNDRFCREVAEWIGLELTTISVATHNQKYKDCRSHFDVFEKVKALRFPSGAPCTRILKREVRENFIKELITNKNLKPQNIIHVWGFTADTNDIARFKRIINNNRNIAPLIEEGIKKQDCFNIWNNGIQLPEQYLRGLPNANCLGCVKGGKGYWNLIRREYPEIFKRMAELERRLNHNIFKDCFLDELDPNAGRNNIYILPCGSTGEGCEINRSIKKINNKDNESEFS